ncbi:MAG: ribokinase [Spirochaetia bacterium]|nr:ribokinase [Spirochaetia bacterium]
MNKILDYGSLNIDKTFLLDHIVQPGETIASYDYKINAGGKGTNQAGALAKAGCNVYMAGKIGPDGIFILDLLKECNVNTQFVHRNSLTTGQALIQVAKNGQNSIILNAGANFENTKDEINNTLNNFSKGDYLILQNEINNIEYLINKAYEKELTICFNPSPFTKDILNLPLEKISYFFVNEVEAAQIAEETNVENYDSILQSLSKKFPSSKIIMTIGKKGAYFSFDKNKIHQEIIDAPVIDTTAAGDTFMGYFIASLIKGYTTSEALFYATKAASITVSKPGALKSIPLKEQVFK